MDAQRDKNIGYRVEPSVEINENQPSSSVNPAENGNFVTNIEERDLSRGLHQRHVSLIAIAGAIVRACLRKPTAAI